MSNLVTSIGIIAGIFYIIYVIMDFMADNFIYEKQNTLLMLVMAILMNIAGFMHSRYYYYDKTATMLVNIAVVTALLGGYLVFQRKRIYYFRGIDNKLINKYKNEITKIIEDYKADNLGRKADINFINNKLIFSKVSKDKTKKCLSLIGTFLDENRREYKLKDYLAYFIKGHLFPAVTAILIFFIFYKLMQLI